MTLVEDIVGEAKEMFGEVYLVGGAVRDMIMGKTPKDYDFSTPLSPDEIEQCLRNFGKKPYLVGKKFGTIGYKTHGLMAESTSFRTETYEEGSRKPVVEYVSDLKEDLSRRDFTMNAVAFDGDHFIDPFAGICDIQLEMIESVGSAGDRFREDPLRMLRAARFASVLGFMPSVDIQNAAYEQAETILTVSKERWVQELDKLLMGDHAENMGLAFLRDTDVLDYMLPEVSSRFSGVGTLEERWASLLAKTGANPYGGGSGRRTALRSHEMAIGICHRLKFSNDRTKFILDSLKAGVVQ